MNKPPMCRQLLAIVLIAAAGLPALSRPAEDPDSERAQLRRQQHELEAQHAQRLADCGKRFEVNKCRDKAMAEHRATLNPLLERERSLDDDERARRALAQSLRSSVRQMDGAASAPAARPARAASQPAVPKRAASSPAEREARRAEKLMKDEEQAAERVRQAQRRQAALAAHAKSVQERNARRAGTPSASLSVPTAASIAALPAASAASRR